MQKSESISALSGLGFRGSGVGFRFGLRKLDLGFGGSGGREGADFGRGKEENP